MSHNTLLAVIFSISPATVLAVENVCNQPLEQAANTFAARKAEFQSGIDGQKKAFETDMDETEKKGKSEGGGNLNFEIEVTWGRTEFVMGVPQVAFKNQEFSLDLPETRLVDQRLVFDMPGVCMVTKKTGQYPQTTCGGGSFQCNGLDCRWKPPECTVTWHDIIADLPEPCMKRQEIVMGVPEFKMVTAKFVAAVPEFSIKDEKIALDLPQFTLKNIKVEKQKKYADEAKGKGETFKAKMESESREFQSQYRAIYAPAISASFKCFGDDVRRQRDAAIVPVNAGIAMYNASVQDTRARGDSATADRLQDQMKQLEGQRDSILQQFSQALIKLDESEKAAIAQLNGQTSTAGQAFIDLEAAANETTSAKYLRY